MAPLQSLSVSVPLCDVCRRMRFASFAVGWRRRWLVSILAFLGPGSGKVTYCCPYALYTRKYTTGWVKSPEPANSPHLVSSGIILVIIE